MKYLLLIHHGTTATPDDQEAWGRLSQEEQNAVYAEIVEGWLDAFGAQALELRPPHLLSGALRGLSPRRHVVHGAKPTVTRSSPR